MVKTCRNSDPPLKIYENLIVLMVDVSWMKEPEKKRAKIYPYVAVDWSKCL